jgi:hypothetical protein
LVPAWARGMPIRGKERVNQTPGSAAQTKNEGFFYFWLDFFISHLISSISLISCSISSSLSRAHAFFILTPHGGYYATNAPQSDVVATVAEHAGEARRGQIRERATFTTSSLVLIWFSLNRVLEKPNSLLGKLTDF